MQLDPLDGLAAVGALLQRGERRACEPPVGAFDILQHDVERHLRCGQPPGRLLELRMRADGARMGRIRSERRENAFQLVQPVGERIRRQDLAGLRSRLRRSGLLRLRRAPPPEEKVSSQPEQKKQDGIFHGATLGMTLRIVFYELGKSSLAA